MKQRTKEEIDRNVKEGKAKEAIAARLIEKEYRYECIASPTDEEDMHEHWDRKFKTPEGQELFVQIKSQKYPRKEDTEPWWSINDSEFLFLKRMIEKNPHSLDNWRYAFLTYDKENVHMMNAFDVYHKMACKNFLPSKNEGGMAYCEFDP